MLDSHNNSRLDHPTRRLITSTSIRRNNDFQIVQANQCTEPLIRQQRVVTLISNTCIARSSNPFILQQNMQNSLSRQGHIATKSRAARALYSKHKKRMQALQKEKRSSIGNYECSILPKGFSRILKTKSTVIRQNKLQEFYINLGDQQQENIVRFQTQASKSNFFKPNLVKKKTKIKRLSSFADKLTKSTDSNACYNDYMKLGRKVDTCESNVSQNDGLVLKERVLINNSQKAIHQKRIIKNISLLKGGKHRNKHQEKQNMEFNLQPWDIDRDDYMF